MRSTDGNTDVVDCCVSTMVLPLFYSSGAVVYRKPVLSVAHHLHNLFYTLPSAASNVMNSNGLRPTTEVSLCLSGEGRPPAKVIRGIITFLLGLLRPYVGVSPE